jgi:hypothetical protein
MPGLAGHFHDRNTGAEALPHAKTIKDRQSSSHRSIPSPGTERKITGTKVRTIQGMARLAHAVVKLEIVVVAVAILAGCKTDGEVGDGAIGRFIGGDYGDVEVVELQLGGETYRVFDKPSANKMIVTKPMGWVLVHGSGWTPKEPFEAAALKHLANTGRSSCRVTEASVIIGPKHEIKYDCTPGSAAAKLKR